MNNIKLWGVPILKAQCPDIDLINTILVDISEYKSSTMGEEHNINEESKDNLWFSSNPHMREMIDVWLQPQLVYWLERCNITENITPDMFINVFDSGNGLLAHYDEYCYGNMIVYLEVDTKSQIILFDPRVQQQLTHGSSYIVHKPQVGEILIFPGWLLHQVTATNARRVSLVSHLRAAND